MVNLGVTFFFKNIVFLNQNFFLLDLFLNSRGNTGHFNLYIMSPWDRFASNFDLGTRENHGKP